MDKIDVGTVVKVGSGARGRTGMVSADRGQRLRVMTRYPHAVHGVILHEELWDKADIEILLTPDGMTWSG